MTYRAKKAILALLAAILVFATAFLCANLARTHVRTAHALPTNTDTIDLGSNGFSPENADKLQELITVLGGTSYDDLSAKIDSGVKTAADLETAKTVTLGGVVFNITYVSKADYTANGTTEGDVIVTLWQASSDLSYTAKFFSGSPWGGPTDVYPTNMYGSSYVRSTLVGSDYLATARGETLTQGTQNSHWEIFTSGALSPYLATPANMEWQETLSVRETVGYTYDLPNEAWGELTDANWDTDGGTNDFNYYGKDTYSDWKNDKIWLPAIAETGYFSIGDYGEIPGLWKVSVEQINPNENKNGYSSWLRSGDRNSVSFGSCADYDSFNQTGQTKSGSMVNEDYCVRPALHLNLKTAADQAIGSGTETYYWAFKPDRLYIGKNQYDNTGNDIVAQGSFESDVVYDGASYTYAPWANKRSSIKSVVIEDNIAPESMAYWFWDMANLTSVDFSGLSTESLTDTNHMFYNCSSLKSLDLSSFDTSKVTNMHSMFSGCSKLETLDLSSFDMSSATIGYNLEDMLYGLDALQSIKVSSSFASKLNTVDLGSTCTLYGEDKTAYSFNSSYGVYKNITAGTYTTDKYVPDIYWGVDGNKTLIISSAESDTNGCTEKGSVKANATTYEYSGSTHTYWENSASDITQVIVKGSVAPTTTKNWFTCFYDCTSFDLSGLDTSNVTKMLFMFAGCNIETITFGENFNTANVTDMWGMFSSCSKLKYIDLSCFDMTKVEYTNEMFFACSALETVIAPQKVGTVALPLPATFCNTNDKKTITEITSTDAGDTLILHETHTYVDGFCSTCNAKMQIYWGLDDGKLTISSTEVSAVSSGSFDFDKTFGATGNTTPWYSSRASITSAEITGNVAPKSTDNWFYNQSNLKSVNLSGLDTSNVESMNNMFLGCSGLTSIDLSRFDTAKVTGMNGMFYGCSGLTSIDLSKFDTSNVTGMSSLFKNCSNLTSITLGSKWNTSKVTNMEDMFYGCSSFISLDLTGFDMSSAKYTRSMFKNCSKLTSVKFGSVSKALNVTLMNNMFEGCKSLTSLDLSGFYTASVINTNRMFFGCSKLESITFSENFKTSNATDMGSMFSGCSALKSLDLSGFNTAKVTDMGSMFSGCSKLESIKFSENFKTLNVKNMSNMFSGCSALKSVDLSSFDTSNVTNMSNMFNGCNAITSLDLSGFNTAKVTDMGSMFSGCYALKSIDLSSFDTSNVTNMSNMFYACRALTEANISSFDMTGVTSGSVMFKDCGVLDTIHAPKAVDKVNPALPATFWNGSSNTESITSNEAGKILKRHESCAGGTATCIGKAVCKICGQGYGEFGTHVLINEQETAATCTDDGVLAHDHCSACGKNFVGSIEKTAEDLKINALGHSYGDWELTKAATCTSDGVETRVCARNGEHKETRNIPAINHTYGNWIDEIPATETENGTKGHKDCSDCNKHFDAENNEITDLVIPATGSAVTQVTITVTDGSIEGADGASVTVNTNSEVTVIAANITGKTFKGWSADGGNTIFNTDVSYTFTATENITLTAVFEINSPADEQRDGGLSGGAIAGISIGLVLFFIIGVYILSYFLLYRRGILKGKFFDVIYAPMNAIFNKKTDDKNS